MLASSTVSFMLLSYTIIFVLRFCHYIFVASLKMFHIIEYASCVYDKYIATTSKNKIEIRGGQIIGSLSGEQITIDCNCWARSRTP